jgi:hypothetical protein
MQPIRDSLACLRGFAAPPDSLRAAEQKDIVHTAVAAKILQDLAAALNAAGLMDTLKGDGRRAIHRLRSHPKQASYQAGSEKPQSQVSTL